MLWTLNNLTAQRTKRVEKLFNLLHFSHPDFFGVHQKNRGRFLTKGLEWAGKDHLYVGGRGRVGKEPGRAKS